MEPELQRQVEPERPSDDLGATLGKWQAIRLAIRLHGQLGLTGRACRALEIIAWPTREDDWRDVDREPVCFRRQAAMAEELGVSTRQFHGSNSGSLETGRLGMRARTSASQA
jgi:hypothetical protein